MPTADTTEARYLLRMQRVVDHIHRHLDGDLGLDVLSGVAAFSPYHFHRQFSAMFGMSLHRYVQMARMKRAASQLAYRADTVTDIAFDAGYEAPDSFARAFRQRMGQAPLAFREQPDWAAWEAAMAPLSRARSQVMTQQFSNEEVTLREVPDTDIAFIGHHGDPQRLGETIRRFIAWRKGNGVRATDHATYTIFHTDPEISGADAYHIDLATEIRRPLTTSDEGVEAGVIPGGRCAVLRVIGNSDDLRPAAVFLYGTWLLASGEELRDFPLYAQRVRFFPDVPEHEAITDLFLPLR